MSRYISLITQHLSTTWLTVALVALLALLAAGCGGDGAAEGEAGGYVPEASTTMLVTKVTKPQFIRRVNRFCRDAWGYIRENVADHRETLDPSLSRQQRLDEIIRVPVLTGFVFHIFDAVRIVGSPPGQEEQIEAIIGPMQVASELGQKRRPALHSIPEVIDRYRVYNQRARAYGLDDCVINQTHLRGIEAEAGRPLTPQGRS